MEILFEFADAGETDLNEIETELYAYKNIVDEVISKGKGLVLVVNKWDLVKKMIIF